MSICSSVPRLFTSLFLLATVLIAAGCDGAPPEPGSAPPLSQEERAEAAEAIRLLEEMDQEVLRDAFAALSGYAYARRLRVEQRNARDELIALRETTIQHGRGEDTPQARVVSVREQGAFEFGFLGAFIDEEVAPGEAAGAEPFLLPEEPAFLLPRNREAYRFRVLPDTSFGSETVNVVEVTARPGTGDDQPLRRARLFLASGTSDVVGLTTEHRGEAFLFDETSRFDVRLQPVASPGGTRHWLPAETHTRVQIKMPLRPARHFDTSTRYTSYAER